jgi:hypothetical protein
MTCSVANVKIEGLDHLVRKFGALTARDLLVPPMTWAVLRVERRMKVYPGPKPGSRYVRGQGMPDADGVVRHFTSEKLGTKWTTKVTKSGTSVTGVVGTTVSYAPLVQSAKWQAKMHAPLWKNTDQAVMDEEQDAIVNQFRKTVREVLNR